MRRPKASEVRRDGQAAAQGFRDEHGSGDLPVHGRLGAAWHGMGPARRLVLAASIVALSMAGGLGIFTALDAIGGEAGAQPHASGQLAAGDGAGAAGQRGLPDGVASGAPQALNATPATPGLAAPAPGAR